MSKRKRSQPITNTNHPQREKPIPDVYPAIDNDLARDNLENDIPEADLPG